MSLKKRILIKKIGLVVAGVFSVFIVYSIFGQSPSEQKVMEYGVLDYSDRSWSLSKAGPAESHFNIIAERPSNVTAKRGTRFDIPKDAFVFDDGTPVRGGVEFKVKEVIDDFDFVTSGVSLTATDENGNEVYFQSAGMFHVAAMAGGKELKLAPGKSIGVEFPDIVPGDEFFVYKMDEKGQWKKHGHNRELLAQGTGSNKQGREDEGYYVGVRNYAIDGLTWWNFDSPYPHVACLKGKIDDPDKVFSPPYTIHSIGMSYKGDFSLYLNDKSFKTVAHRSKTIKLFVVDSKENAGVSAVIQVSRKKGHFKYKEGEMVAEVDEKTYRLSGKKYRNFCQDVGKIVIKKLPANVLKDKKAFSRYLGLNPEYYHVSYPTDGSKKSREMRSISPP